MATIQGSTIADSHSENSNVTMLAGDSFIYQVLKRLIDVVVSSLILILGLPLWVVIAISIKISSLGPVLYVERREIGKDGNTFTYYKFRSMHVNRDERIHREAYRRYLNGEALGQVRDKKGNIRSVYKIVNDPRIHGVGHVLRKTGLDEIPQFINVLRGEMSIVGPRPAIWYEWELYQEHHKARLSVKPGITGYYQVSGRGDVGFEEMYRLDMEYIAHRSLWLDLKIMLDTPWVMVTGKGTH